MLKKFSIFVAVACAFVYAGVVCVFRAKSAMVTEQIGHHHGAFRPPSRTKSATLSVDFGHPDLIAT